MKTADWIRAAPNEMPSLLGPFLLQITRLIAYIAYSAQTGRANQEV